MRGFSVIELLIVLAICGIIAAIALPSACATKPTTVEAEVGPPWLQIQRESGIGVMSGVVVAACDTKTGNLIYVLKGSAITVVPNGCAK